VTAPATSAAVPTARSLRGPAVAAGAGLAALVLLRLRDPHDAGSYGACPFLSVTGLPCPGCGGLRALDELAGGDVVAAISSNALVVALAAAVAVVWTGWTIGRIRGRMPVISPGAGTLLLVVPVIAAFGILRVTPWGSWLAP